MKITILMPSLDEEKSIGKTVRSIPFDVLVDRGFDTEVLLIDGGSADSTVNIARSLGVRVLVSQRGYGRQYRLGFKEAKGDIIITGDSDSSYPMQDIPRLLEIFERENLDFISANRYANMTDGSMRWINNIGNKFLTFLTNFLFALNLKDSQSGMWVIRKVSLEKIALKSNGMSLSQEIKIESFKKLKAKEVDSSYSKRVGQTKLRVFQDGWGNVIHLVKKKAGWN